jgi:two-component system LytT family response regulator
MTIKCLLVDDEPLAIKLLQKHIEQLEFIKVVDTCNNAVKALEILNSQEIDLLFLDIKMPKISGLELLKTLSKPPKTILTTAHREFALDGFEFGVIDYLLKPITFERFFKAIERYLKNNAVMPAGNTLPISKESFINIKSGSKNFRINTQDILYAESLKDYIKLHTKEKAIVAKYKISDFETQMSDKGFLRVHRSFIINIKNITAFTATDIEINNTEIPIGESYKRDVFKILNKVSS